MSVMAVIVPMLGGMGIGFALRGLLDVYAKPKVEQRPEIPSPSLRTVQLLANSEALNAIELGREVAALRLLLTAQCSYSYRLEEIIFERCEQHERKDLYEQRPPVVAMLEFIDRHEWDSFEFLVACRTAAQEKRTQ